MSRIAALSLVIVLIGCGGDESRPDPSTTTTEQAASTTAESVASSTSTTPVPSSTSTTNADEGAGDEAITVTEKITITIKDPEDR